MPFDVTPEGFVIEADPLAGDRPGVVEEEIDAGTSRFHCRGILTQREEKIIPSRTGTGGNILARGGRMRKFLAGFGLGLAVLPLSVIVVSSLGCWPVHADARPSRWEERIGRLALDSSVARRAARVSNPVPATDEELLAGMRFYRNNCAGCHGDSQGPSAWGTRGFYPRVPQFAQDPPRKPDWQIFWVAKHGVRYSGMGAWQRARSGPEALAGGRLPEPASLAASRRRDAMAQAAFETLNDQPLGAGWRGCRPCRRSMACGISGAIARRQSCAPRGEPGRETTRVRPRTPAT